MGIEIKKVQQSDISDFANEQWGIVNEKYNLLPPKKTIFWGIYLDNKLVGYAKVDIRGGLMEIRDLLIEDGLTGKGVGSGLIKHIEIWGKENKCKKSVLKVSSVYEKSIRFYEKNGYKKDVCLKNYYYGYDWYYMSKEL